MRIEMFDQERGLIDQTLFLMAGETQRPGMFEELWNRSDSQVRTADFDLLRFQQTQRRQGNIASVLVNHAAHYASIPSDFLKTLTERLSLPTSKMFRHPEQCRSEPRSFDYEIGGSNNEVEHIREFRRQMCRGVPVL